MSDLFTLPATEAVRLIAEGRISSVELVQSCLDRIEATEPCLKAWAHLDPDAALAQAAEADRIRKAGRPMGALHGVPVGLKDIIDTKDAPCARGTPIFAGRRPDNDAAIVERLRESGAVILGKTVTTELAFVHAAETRNPVDATRSPGGSSSGSAVGVAAQNMPLAIGTQTNGSVIRPASFCGTFGFKPTRGVISRRGILQTSASLDQVGTFGRTLEDVALLVDVIGHYDPADPLSYARPRPRALEGARAEAPLTPSLLWLDMPYHDRLEDDAREGFDSILDLLGSGVERLPAADNLAALVGVQATLHEYEICEHLDDVFRSNWDDLSDGIKEKIESGRAIGREAYEEALSVMSSAQTVFDTLFNDYDAIIAPSAAGEAPLFGPFTGDPTFCSIWTTAGLPALNIPVMVGAHDLPIGVQLIGGREEDDRLMRTARWLIDTLND